MKSKIGFTDPYIKNLHIIGRHTDPATSGLNLNIKNRGGKYWVFRYLYGEKRCDLSLGVYPRISLKEARIRALACRNDLAQGRKPVAYWKGVKPVEEAQKPLFKDYANECIESKKAEWDNAKHTYQWFRTIEVYANPIIGNKAIDEIDTEDVLKVLTPLWYSKTETATRLRGRLEWILASATTRKLRTGINPAAWRGHLETILPKPTKIATVQHHPALLYSSIPDFIKNLQNRDGVAALALEFLILNANRTGEVIGGLKSEVDFTSGVWVIPAQRMKARREHRVPLGKRALEILEVAKSFEPQSEYLFSIKNKPLSNMALPMLIRRMELPCHITVHGFRSTFRDWVAEETQHSPEVAEKALAHAIANQTEAAYRRGDLLEHRRRLLKDWEDYCQAGALGNVVQISALLKVV